MYELNNNVIYFDSFGDEHILKEIKFFGNKNIQTNIFRIQAYNSVICGCVDLLVLDLLILCLKAKA